MSNVTREVRPRLAQAVQLEDGLFAKLKVLGIAESDLRRDVDGIVMQAFCLGQTEAAEAIATGAKVQGYLYDASDNDLGYEVAVSPTGPPLNPSFDDCGCRWGRSAWEEGLARGARDGVSEGYVSLQNGELLHGWLLQLDGPDSLFAVGQLLNHFSDHVMPVIDFEVIVAQHNWSDPVVMQEFASMMEYTWGKITVANRFDEIATGITDPAQLPERFRGRIRVSLVK